MSDELFELIMSKDINGLINALSKATTLDSDIHGATALAWAIKAGNSQAVRLLLEWGVNPNELSGADRQSPLMLSAFLGEVLIVEMLLSAGADVNCADANGITALMDASKSGNLDIVRQLINTGSDVNAADCAGRTPLHWAACNGDNVQIASELVAVGASINVCTNTGDTPFEYAKAMNRHEMVSFFSKCS